MTSDGTVVSKQALILGLCLAVLAATWAAPGAVPTSGISGKIDPGLLAAAARTPTSMLAVIVRERRAGSTEAETLVRELGGRVGRELPIVNGFAAELPGAEVTSLAGSGAVAKLWGDAPIRVNTVDMDKYDRSGPDVVWQDAIRLSQVRSEGSNGHLGAGATVALIDTGVSKLPDLGNRVVARVDFTPEADGVDRYGHGTHMAGLIVGDGGSSNRAYMGVAPKANLVSLKVAGADGSTDVSVVLAAIEWVVAYRASYNIRVLNLSFGTDARQSYSVDPLDYAVERAWFAGISVVVSAGNRGAGAGTINKPGDDPYVITVGSADFQNTNKTSDDTVAEFSSRGPTQDGFAKPDLVAPGVTLISGRAAGSTIDRFHPDARVGEYYFKGTGTSQSAAIVSGILALLYEANPRLTPDQAKAVLVASAQKYLASRPGAGAGVVDAQTAVAMATRTNGLPAVNRGLRPSTGLGSLEGSRGSNHVYVDLNGDGVTEVLQGELDALGRRWDGRSWSGRSWSSAAWSGSVWCSTTTVSTGWSAPVWVGRSWSGTSWDGRSWSANDWAGRSWSGRSWS